MDTTTVGSLLPDEQNSKAMFRISQPIAMVDEVIKLSICHLKPFQKITIIALVKESPAMYLSHGHYIADSEGHVDVMNCASQGGTYTGIDGMGLFWSMVPSKEQLKGSRLYKKDSSTPYHVQVGVLNTFIDVDSWNSVKSNFLCETKLERWYLSTDTQRVEVRAGRLRGALFYPKSGSTRPGVIDMFGSAGGLMEYRASMLASYGYTTLALAYFQYDDLTKNIDFDYDYFDEAVRYMLEHPMVDSSQDLAVVGVSKGAEIALHMASYNPRIKVCVSINGVPFYQFGSNSYKDKQLPTADYNYDNMFETPYGNAFRRAIKNSDYENERVPVENSRAHFLILQSGDDHAIDSNLAIELAEKILESGNRNCVLRIYPGAGHLLEPPFTPLCRSTYHKIMGGLIDYGGELRMHGRAQEQMWADLLKFLGRHFRTDYKRTGRIPPSHI